MVGAAWAGAEDADAMLLIVDAADLTANANSPAARDTMAILEGLKHGKGTKKRAGAEQDRRHEAHRPAAAGGAIPCRRRVRGCVPGLGAERRGRRRCRRPGSRRACREGPWLYPEDQAADIPSRLLAAEITREKIYLRLHDELPYASAVETEKWEERRDGSVRIDQVIYVQRDGQKAIVLGKGGATIKMIGELARKELEECSAAACICSCSSRCARTGPRTREHYRAKSGLEFPKERVASWNGAWTDGHRPVRPARMARPAPSWKC